MKIFPWAHFNHQKSAFKLHVGLDHDGLIPAFASVTLGSDSETEQAKQFDFPKGSVVVFDRGYNNYHWHESLTNKGVFWVGRIRSRTNYRILERRAIDSRSGITSDQIIQYSSRQKRRNQLPPIRRVGYRCAETGKHLVFITNQMNWSAKTIAEIYKQRWQVELFFKWIKQNLKIKSFLGNSKNAVLTQIFAALCVYLLTAFLKFQVQTKKSLQDVFRLLQTNLFSKTTFRTLLFPPPKERYVNHAQLALALARR
jgi:putative transposase